MYYFIVVLAVITAINILWTLLDHEGMSAGKIILSCIFRIEFVVLIAIIVIIDTFNVDDLIWRLKGKGK